MKYEHIENIIIFVFVAIIISVSIYESHKVITFKSPTELILDTAETRLANGMSEEDVKKLLIDEMQVLEDSIDNNKGRFTITPIMRNRIWLWFANNFEKGMDGNEKFKEPKNAKVILIKYKDGVVGRVIYDADKNSLETQEDVVKYLYKKHIKSSEIEQVSIGNSNNIFYDLFLVLVSLFNVVIAMIVLFFLPYYIVKGSWEMIKKGKEEKALLVNKTEEMEKLLNEKDFIENIELDIKNY